MTWKEILQQEYGDKLRLEWNVPLAKYTTFHIGGPAECLIAARSSEEVQIVLRFGKKYQVPVHILGNGSNLLVDDAGVEDLPVPDGLRRVTYSHHLCLRIEVGASCSTALTG